MLLIKFPTRERHSKALDVLSRYDYYASDPKNITYLITLDEDDITEEIINNYEALLMATRSKYYICKGKKENKIEAINRDIEAVKEWDVLLVASDDMIPYEKGYDKIIREKVKENFPGLNGCIWFWDGHQRRICTLPVMGRKAYDNQGYVYHPSYKSLWADNEFTDVFNQDFRLIQVDRCIIRHESPAWKKGAISQVLADRLWIHNEKFNTEDRNNYEKRKKNGFK